MKNKFKLALIPILSIFLITACNPSTSSTNSNLPTSSNTDSNGQTSSLKNLQPILEKYYTKNITFNSNVLFYIYPVNEDISKQQVLQEFEVTTKYTEDKYLFEAKLKGEDYIYSSLAFSKNNEGNLIYQHLNINNEVVEENAKNQNNENIKFDDSIYRNLLSYLSEDDLAYDSSLNAHKVKLTKNNKQLISDIAASSTNTTNFYPDFVQSAYLKFDNDSLVSLTIQEKEDDTIYQGYMYGRKITINFSNINSTSIDKLTEYQAPSDNTSLKNAIEKIKNASNYTITKTGYIDDQNNKVFTKSKLTETSLFETNLLLETNSFHYSGFNIVDNKTYSFSSEDSSNLVGVQSNEDFLANKPNFDFSTDFFKMKEENGNKIFELEYTQFPNILDLISFDKSLSGDYYNGYSEKISFTVDSNDNLIKVSFPSNIPYIDSSTNELKSSKGIYTLSYSDIGNTSTEEDLKGFKLEIDVNEFTSYDDSRLSFDNNGTKMTISELFTQLLPNQEIPFVLPKSIKSYSNISFTGKNAEIEEDTLTLESDSIPNETEMNDIYTLLETDGFEKVDEIIEADMVDKTYSKEFTDISKTLDIHFSYDNTYGLLVEFIIY